MTDNEEVLRGNGRIASLVKNPRTTKTCSVCGKLAAAGEPRYNVTWAGAGLGSIKFPDIAHTGSCVDTYVKERK